MADVGKGRQGSICILARMCSEEPLWFLHVPFMYVTYPRVPAGGWGRSKRKQQNNTQNFCLKSIR